MKKRVRVSVSRVTAILWMSALVVGTLAGCSRKEKADMGRYVEEEIPLSDSVSGPFYASYDEEGNLTYYVSQNNRVTRNVLSKSGGVDSKEVVWLGTIIANGGNILGYSENEDGVAYALYSDSNGKSELARSSDGTDYETVAVPELKNQSDTGNDASTSIGTEDENGNQFEQKVEGEVEGKSESLNPDGESGPLTEDGVPDGGGVPDQAGKPTGNGSQMQRSQITNNGSNGPVKRTIQAGQLMPTGVYALKEGFLIDYGTEGVYQYDGNESLVRKYNSESGEDGPTGIMMGRGNQTAVYEYVLAVIDKNAKEVTLYDLKTGDQTETLPYGEFEDGAFLGIDKDGVYVGDSSGISRWSKDEFEQIVDGGLTSLIQPNLTIHQLLRNANGEYHAFLGDGMSCQLFRYQYDEGVPKEPETVLEVFSLYDNGTIRYAIGEFQRRNPNVKVSLKVGMEEDGGATAEDVIRALNTELIAGKGPDLLVLDGLPIDSYIEKGVLKDVTAMKDKLVADEGLMENLTEAYGKDEKTYGLPSRFVMPVIMGDAELVGSIGSLADLVETVKNNQSQDKAVLRAPEELWESGLIMEYYEACVNDWMKDDGTIDEEKLTEFFSQMLTLDGLLKEITPETSSMTRRGMITMGGGGMESVNFGSQDIKDGKAVVHIEKLIGMGGLTNILNNLGDASGTDLTSLFGRNQYYPQGGVGVVSSGKQQELAESFMELVFSDAVQGQYLYDGFPVNGNSLKKMVEERMDDIKEKMNVDVEDDMDFLQMCSGLTNAVWIDQVVKDKVQSQVEGLISGTVTPEEAAAKVVEDTRLYLVE